MTGEHEGRENLSNLTLDLERARQSLIEELQAINWYMERVEACKDDELRHILKHNMNEEKEHAAMLFQWILKHDPEQLKVMNEHD
ncbi:MAG: ferritin [Candidatus Thermoplasmatota archaeon]|jgi:hypothetical protein|nr:ferritin [Candidatus Thermoplasmatota archaeon]MCL5962866.1 ferritin [Candidatus Thermoplasmatota archaeon]